jgi:hypothetical protein
VSIHVTEATVDSAGRIILDHVPFGPGERVDVVVKAHLDVQAANLLGSVIRFENPLDPVATDDWEVQR